VSPQLSATQLSSHKSHKARFRIQQRRSSDDTRTSALNALNPIILVVSVILVATPVTALHALLFLLLTLNFLHSLGLDFFRIEQTKDFSNMFIYFGNKDQLKCAAVTFRVVGQFAVLLVILYIANKVAN
jgi:flagellar biosynthesis protein FlhB